MNPSIPTPTHSASSSNFSAQQNSQPSFTAATTSTTATSSGTNSPNPSLNGNGSNTQAGGSNTLGYNNSTAPPPQGQGQNSHLPPHAFVANVHHPGSGIVSGSGVVGGIGGIGGGSGPSIVTSGLPSGAGVGGSMTGIPGPNQHQQHQLPPHPHQHHPHAPHSAYPTGNNHNQSHGHQIPPHLSAGNNGGPIGIGGGSHQNLNLNLAPQQSPHAYRQYLSDLSTSLFSFVLPLLPTSEELATKEEVRVLIERLIKTIEPSSRLMSFGSSCNSFGLRNSDMDLVCLIDDKQAALHASDLVAMIGDLLERETNFEVKPLPKARIPIIKLTLNPSPGLPFGIACDIGFENRLALENTRLLLTYATIDPARVRTLVLFLKVWSKRRKINSPYRGTLSSYGFTLMVIFFLVHVKNPPVLPNLQRIAPLRPMTKEEVTLEGRDVWFFDDTEMLRKEWSSANFESVGELLIDFFRFYSHDFQYNNTVISIRAGHLTKESKGWMNDIDVGGLNENARDRNRLCIEDPFETPYNVARTVTKDGLYTIRGEFMRATRILTGRPERAVLALAELCLEREDELARAPRSASPAPRNVSSGRSPFALGGGWRNHMSNSAYDRLSPTLNGLLGPGDAEEMGRRAYTSHVPGRRGRQSEPGDMRQYSAQELWLANQNLGLDFQLPPPMQNGRPVGFGDYLRGRDTLQRGLEPQGMGGYQPRRAGSVNEGVSPSAGGTGSASAPISPIKGVGHIQSEAPARMASGTWSTGPSPRPASAARLPPVDPRGFSSQGYQQRRPSGNGPSRGGYDARPPFHQGNGPRFQAQGFNASGSGRRAYSAGPSQHSSIPGGNGEIPPMSAPPITTAEESSLPPFQPFATSPGNPSHMPASLGQQSEPSFISPSALLSPETKGDTPLNPFPIYQSSMPPRSAPGSARHSRQASLKENDSEFSQQKTDTKVDELAAGINKVALGLEGTDEGQILNVETEEPIKQTKVPLSAGLPPKPKPSAEARTDPIRKASA